MHIHDYIIISQNKQDNSRLCTILDYHLVSSDHDESTTTVNLTEAGKIDFLRRAKSIFWGGQSKRLKPIVSVNRAFTEAVNVIKPPLLK